jgi:hypothetical protein
MSVLPKLLQTAKVKRFILGAEHGPGKPFHDVTPPLLPEASGQVPVPEQSEDGASDFRGAIGIYEQSVVPMVDQLRPAPPRGVNRWAACCHSVQRHQSKTLRVRRQHCHSRCLENVQQSFKRHMLMEMNAVGRRSRKESAQMVPHGTSAFSLPILPPDMQRCFGISLLHLRPALDER